jgi:hypothetical protein
MKSSDLNGISDISDVGDVDMFGLDAFGNPVGLGAVWGSLVGGGLGTATSIGIRSMAKSPSLYKWSEGIGFASGALAGGVMMAFEASRHSGVAAIATALATNGLRQIEALLGPSKALAGYVADPTVAKQLTAILATQASKTGVPAPKAVAQLPAPAAPTPAAASAAADKLAALNADKVACDSAEGGMLVNADGTATSTVKNTDGTFTVTTYESKDVATVMSVEYYNADGTVNDGAGAGGAPAVAPDDGTSMGAQASKILFSGATRFSRTGVVNGLNGTTVIEPTGVVQGAGHDGLPQLVGASSKSQKVNSATLLGVPGLNSPFSGISGHFGSSIIG